MQLLSIRSKSITRMRRAVLLGYLLLMGSIFASVAGGQPPEPPPSASAPQSASATSSKTLVDFARDIAPILQSRCASCHEGEKAKNGFMVADRDALLGFVEAGSAAESSLWTDYLIAPKETLSAPSLLMPPDGPLPPSELALLKLWIEEGADWPAGVGISTKPDATKTEVSAGSTSPNWFRALGYFHPAVVHFPIALLAIAAASVMLSYVLGDRYSQFAYTCVVLGFLFSIATAVMGWSFAESRGYGDWSKMLTTGASETQSNIFFHRWLGSAIVVVGAFVVVTGWRARQADGTRPGHAWRIGALVLAIMVMIVGHQGGELVYGDLLAKAMEQLSK